MGVDGGSVRGCGGVVRESDDMLTEAEEQGYLNDFQETLHVGKAQVKRIQRNCRNRDCWYFFQGLEPCFGEGQLPEFPMA